MISHDRGAAGKKLDWSQFFMALSICVIATAGLVGSINQQRRTREINQRLDWIESYLTQPAERLPNRLQPPASGLKPQVSSLKPQD